MVGGGEELLGLGRGQRRTFRGDVNEMVVRVAVKDARVWRLAHGVLLHDPLGLAGLVREAE